MHDVEDGHILYTENAMVKAEQILFATHVPFLQPPGLFFKKGTYITHVFELEMSKGTLEEGLYEDTRNPYHYFRVDHLPQKTRVIVGGEDHRRDMPIPDNFCERGLEQFVKMTFGHLAYTIVNRWRGPIIESADGLPLIGPYHHGSTFYATGFSGNGLTYGTLAAIMFADHVLRRENQWKDIFNAQRFPSLKGLLFKSRDYIGAFFGGAIKNLFGRF